MMWLKYIVPLLLWACCSSQNVCEEPPEVDFADTVGAERAEYQRNDRVQYRCSAGYSLEGPEWLTCEGPKWTSPPPKCLAPCTIMKQQLEAKHLFLSGGRRRSQVISNNQTLEFQCSEGYVLLTPSARKCIDGHMDLPSCISERGKNCSRPPTIKNGDIITLSQEQYTSGSSVEFKCQRYYAMEGESRSFCDNGNWTKAPVCLEPCVILLAEIGRWKLRSNDNEPTLYLQRGDSVKLSCEPGHVLATDTSQDAFDLQCKGGPIVYPECKEITCPPPAVNNGRVDPDKQQYSNEETVEIQCDPGYKPDREPTSWCTKMGWLPPPRCIAKLCDYPEGGSVQVYGYSWEYRHGYFPKREGDYISFRCNSGFLPANKQNQGWKYSTCTKSRWEPEPKCFKQCDHTGGFLHGSFIYGQQNKFIEGNEISFSCDTGYHPEPQEAKVKCTKNGWSPVPRCATRVITDPNANCGRPPPIRNGDFLDRVQAEYEPGTTLRYQCQNLYVMNGSAEVRCENGHWTQPPTCIEACTVSEEDMRRNNIQLKWRSDPKLYSQSGDEMEFQCLRYYREDPSSPPMRTRCIEGRVEYPRCIPNW